MKNLEPLELDLSGTTLIEASAGTGKTYTLTTLYLRLLVERDLLPAQILVVTYTQAATAELRDRVRARIREAIAAGEAGAAPEEGRFSPEACRLGAAARAKASASGGADPLRRALREFDEAAIFTIHGFCQRALGQNAFESGAAFDAELIEGADVLNQTLARDLWARGLSGQNSRFVEWLLEGSGRRWNFRPEQLKGDLLDQLGADEEMSVRPEADAANIGELESVAEKLESSLKMAWEGWARAWASSRDRVATWLVETDDLNRNKFKVRTIQEKWLTKLDAWSADLTSRNSFAAPMDLPDWWRKLTPEGLSDGVKKNGVPLEDPAFEAFAEVDRYQTEITENYAARALALRRWVVEEARAEAKRRRTERHQWLFDDLLSELRGALRPPGGNRLVGELRRQYRYALIDEFQDTDPVQYEIFRRIWHRERDGSETSESEGMVLIGDPKQAIYSFRGADLFTYLSASRDAAESVYGLDVNYRSDPGLIAAVNELFGRPERAFGFDDIAFHRVSPRPDVSIRLEASNRSTAGMRVLYADYEKFAEMGTEAVAPPDPPPEAEKKKTKGAKKERKKELPLRFGRTALMAALARDVAELFESDAKIDGRPVVPGDVAILCRRKSELERARRALESLGIPCVDRGDTDVFETREAWEMLCVLRAMLRSGDASLLRAALATGAIGWNALALSTLGDESDELAEISERYADYARIWKQSGFMRAFDAWRRNEDIAQRLLRYTDGDRRLTNWLHIAELLQRVASERSPSRSSLVNWLERAIADPDVRKIFGSEASLLRLESDDEAVSLVTLHRSKGLEYEIVYLPALWENTSPRGPSEKNASKDIGQKPPVRCHDSESNERILDLGGPRYAENLDRQKQEAISESNRLLYVGMTRAKSQCVLLWGAIGNGVYASTPLATLLAAPLMVDPSAGDKHDAEAVTEIRGWDDADWRRAFTALGDAAGKGALSIDFADWTDRDRWRESLADRTELVFDREPRPIPVARVTTSFSGLTRGVSRLLATSSGPDAIGRDLDTKTEFASIAEPAGPTDLEADMGAFPRGADAGTLLHEILEHVDFAAWDESEVRSSAAKALDSHGFSPAHEEQVLHVVRSVAETSLRQAPEPFRLADVKSGNLRAEMEFTLAAPGDSTSFGFSPEHLSKLLSQATKGSPLECYADRVGRLSWHRLSGFLRGFIDAVFFDGQRYFLIDYKSNHLGFHQSDYLQKNLLTPMIEHDYILQYLIYSVALDRHLAQTLSGYSYEEHFGGAYYLFLRGLSQAHPPGCGVFFDRPEESLLRAVSDGIGAAFQGAA